MASKKYLIIAFVISAGVAFGVFTFAPVSKTLYIKNNTPYLATADIQQTTSQNDNKTGDLSNTIIPSINVPKNLTEDFAASLTRELISKNQNPTTDSSGQPTLATPDINSMAENFIKNGLTQANKNILNIKPPDLKISYDNGKTAIENYLSEIRTIINNNLKTGDSLFSILDEINKNNGAGLERLLPIISSHEAAANQIEEKPVPSSLKDLMTEEIRLLRITANILRALTNIENDPMGTIAATQQFGAILQNWQDLQNKMDLFIQKLNQS
ncbi:MAG: hypothetical protein NTV77_03730 [Candidatus Azambacteria bacterium]|nr:hypothetical protein [Candidatus Azambacteria bacterium]